ncbi:MAG: hypothetical protein RSA94_00510 [Mucinivorans sp.]
MNRWLKITLWVVGSLLGVIFLVLGLALWLLTPERLTPIVNQYASEYLEADVKFEKIDVSIFSDFPHLALSLLDGQVISRALPNERDTLLKFKQLDISINAWDLILRQRANVRAVSLSRARLRALIDTSGHASWDILRPAAPDSDTSSSSFTFNLHRAVIDRGFEIYFFDARDSTTFTAGFEGLSFEGELGDDLSKLRIDQLKSKNIGARGYIPSQGLRFESLAHEIAIEKLPSQKGYHLIFNSQNSLTAHGDTLADKLPLNIASSFSFALAPTKHITLSATTVTIASVAVELQGSLCATNDSIISSDLSVSLPALSVADALSYVPQSLKGTIGKLSTDITLNFRSHITGAYNMSQGRLPHIKARILSTDGFLAYQGVKARVDHFVIDALADYNPDHIEKSMVALRRLEIQGSGIDIKASGSVSDFLRDLLLDGKVEAAIDLTRLSFEFPSTRGITASGKVLLDASCRARLSNLYLGGLAHTTIASRVDFDNTHISSPLDSLDFTGRGHITFRSNKNKADSVVERGLAVLRTSLTLDTLHLKMGHALMVAGRDLSVSALTGASRYGKKEKKQVVPFHGTLSAARMMVQGADSAMIRMRKVNFDFSVTPSPGDRHIPRLVATLFAQRASASAGLNRYSMRDANFSFVSTILSREQDSLLRRSAMLDALQKRYPQVARQDLMLYGRMMRSVGIAKKDELASGDLDLKMSDDFISILRRWRSTGQVTVASLGLVTPYVPLRTRLTGLDFAFTNDSVALKNARIKVGHSDIELSGRITNLGRALSGRGNLGIKFAVTGDTLDLNELVMALNSGASSMDQVEHMITSQTTEQEAAEIIATQNAEQQASQLIIVPKNIDMQLDLEVKHATWGDLTMNYLHGELITHNRILQINDLGALSSIGAIECNAVYATHSKQDITTGFDIELRGVDVGALIDLLPQVDSLLPMLNSFEGKLNCTLAATASLDSTMTILIPTLNAAGSISGTDMVLLDGQTFSEIAKIARFKNSSRNLVDRISVEMLVRNSAIEIFPFILQLDRYKAAVSGVQKLDMSFDYHISVLKSIIPFRLGVDIYGNTDKWKFRITKARYKDENVPSYTALIDTTRIDLRRAITDIFHTGVEKLVLHQSSVVPHVDSSELVKADSLSTVVVQ